jgi:DUF4097 and DUF4098 domain-containing protein YvlB
MNRKVIWPALLLGVLHANVLLAGAKVEFTRTVQLAPSDHIILDVSIPKGDVNISYAHAGEISVTATAQASEGTIAADFFERGLLVQREGEHLKVQFNSNGAAPNERIRVVYTIEVANWIEVNANVGTGKLSVSGVRGPVKAVTGSGDVSVFYITSEAEARTGRGDINVIRVGSGARVETGSGNITMKDIGPGSGATVKKGTGRLDADGIHGSFTGATDAGELRVAGGVYDNWDLQSASGNIHLNIGSDSHFEIDAATRTGQLSIENEAIELPKGADVRACHQKVNGGGKMVHVRSASGTIFLK